jgi:hypothetical protein
VRDRHRQRLARDPGVAGLEQVRGAPVQQVLRDVEVVLDDRDPLPSAPSITSARAVSRDWTPYEAERRVECMCGSAP